MKPSNPLETVYLASVYAVKDILSQLKQNKIGREEAIQKCIERLEQKWSNAQTDGCDKYEDLLCKKTIRFKNGKGKGKPLERLLEVQWKLEVDADHFAEEICVSNGLLWV